MEDCIKIEEIKMFIGTDLQINEDGRTIRGVDEDLVIDSNNDEYYLNEIKPLVKPLSDFTVEEFKQICENVDELTMYYDSIDIDNFDITFIVNELGNGANYTTSSFIMLLNELANRHYDIFNWTERELSNKLI